MPSEDPPKGYVINCRARADSTSRTKCPLRQNSIVTEDVHGSRELAYPVVGITSPLRSKPVRNLAGGNRGCNSKGKMVLHKQLRSLNFSKN
jgi:hypothetical protein